MSTEQTAQQLELAAQIIRTGHPWKSSPQAPDTDIYSALRDGFEIRPVLATPPDGRPLHNPDNLDAEKVGVGYRLVVKDDSCNQPHELWLTDDQEWVQGAQTYCTFKGLEHSYRLPLSVPWPPAPVDPYAELKKAHADGKVIQSFNHERSIWQDCPSPAFEGGTDYRIKPDAPTFQLPPPPPGMQWHRTDGWQEGDLPQGCRPGDPMPCDGEARIEIVCHEGRTEQEDGIKYLPRLARNNIWNKTLGWRYADEKKTVPLGPEDVPPFSILRLKGFGDPWNWMPIESVDPCFGIRVISKEVSTSHEWIGWGNLKEYEINRSLPLTGKWNPDSWEPCHKIISENG